MDQSINLFTQSWAAAPPPPTATLQTGAPSPPLAFAPAGDKCLTEAIRGAAALTGMWQWDTQDTQPTRRQSAPPHPSTVASRTVINQTRQSQPPTPTM